jgi:hypothetical protein
MKCDGDSNNATDLFQQLIGWTKYKGKWSIDLEGTNFVVSVTLWKLRIEMALGQIGDRLKWRMR